MANTVTLTFEGDASGANRALDSVGASAKEMADDLDKASDDAKKMGKSAAEMGDGLGKTAGGLRGTNDLLSGFSEVSGVALPAQAGLIMGFADMADGLGAVLAPALKMVQAGFWKLTAAMLSNPIGVIIGLLVALGIGFVILWKKSETFRNIILGVWQKVKDATGAVIGFIADKFSWVGGLIKAYVGVWWTVISGVFTRIKGAAGTMVNGIKAVFSGIGNAITAPFSAAISGLKSLWNSLLGGKGFSVPSWVPGIGGKGFTIPYLANGGRASEGMPYIVGERGPELFMPGQTGMVASNKSLQGMGGGGNVTIIFEKSGDPLDDLLIERLRKSVRVRGGTVQTVLGT